MTGGRGGLPPLIVLAGATATGKTELAIRIGESLAGDGRPVAIISADSRQVYRGMDIGTAKATPADQARIPHHGLDLADPDHAFSVADFVDHTRRALIELGERGGIGILAGGTGLYLRAVGSGLDTAALPSDAEIRAQLETELVAGGLESLVVRLQAIAPRRAASIDLHNPRRVVRALEMASITGDEPPPVPVGYAGVSRWFGLTLEPRAHADRIALRARSQFDAGLIAEAGALRERFDPRVSAFSAIGYREAWSVIDGERTLDEAIDEDVRRNIAFAKRQRTWFRSEPDITWFDATSESVSRQIVETMLRATP